jgi:hypothetical protein
VWARVDCSPVADDGTLLELELELELGDLDEEGLLSLALAGGEELPVVNVGSVVVPVTAVGVSGNVLPMSAVGVITVGATGGIVMG